MKIIKNTHYKHAKNNYLVLQIFIINLSMIKWKKYISQIDKIFYPYILTFEIIWLEMQWFMYCNIKW